MEPNAPLAAGPVSFPEWYPAWARQFAELYISDANCVFVFHGNVHDLIRCPGPDGSENYGNLMQFLSEQVFGQWDVVVQYDLAKGLRPAVGGNQKRLLDMQKFLTSKFGEPVSWPREPEPVLLALDKLIDRLLVEEDQAQRKSIALLFDYAQYLVPATDLPSLSRGSGTNLVRFLNWAQNPFVKRANVAICLVTDKITEVNDRLTSNAHVAAIQLPMPERAERLQFCQWMAKTQKLSELTDFTPEELADLSNGLSLTSLNSLLAQGKAGSKVGVERFKQLKKTLIERQCGGLIEFVEPKHTLDLVVGQEAAKQRLKQDAALLQKGRFDAAPMGYLFCGPVGTGKTFLAECYAGSVGIPCVKLRNFRSKYVGETESNLEQVLNVLRSLGPVVVMIDEADAALGDREGGGDSGTSSRVFAMIASQMGDTQYRGKIVWMLMTARPELLPIDLKRQGRAEVHIPLFYPQDEEEIAEMFKVLAKKNKLKLAEGAIPPIQPDRYLSGSDIESVVLAAKRQMLAEGRDEMTRADIDQAFREFIPSAQGLEKEYQELAAVLECTQLSFLPQHWREAVSAPSGRSRLQERMSEIRTLLK